VFQAAVANFNPWSETRVNFRNGRRAPLLMIVGTDDHQAPAAMSRSNFKLYARSTAITAFKEFPGRSHLIIAQRGWEEVADHALAWAESMLPAATTGVLQFKSRRLENVNN
jgi:hypothetical protein